MAASSSCAPANSSSASALPGDAVAQDDAGLPAQLVQALKDARPQCPFYGTKRGCRKGRKCQLSHGTANADRIPHVSRHVADDGSTYLTLRPPLLKGLERFFEHRKCPVPISNGQTWRLANGSFVVTFATPLMEAPDVFACSEARIRGFASIGNDKLYASTCVFSGFILHSTSVPNALDILCSGRINVGPGICGEGVYGFETASQENESLEKAWQRGISGGYGWGAAFLLKCEGIVVNGSSDQKVPPGAVARKKDQFAVAAKTATYVSVTFARDVLIGAIANEMDSVGYSQQLHSALVEVQQHFDNRMSGPLPDSAKLLSNAVVLKHKPGRQRQQHSPSSAAAAQPTTPTTTANESATATATAALAQQQQQQLQQWQQNQDWHRQQRAQHEWQLRQALQQHAAAASATAATAAAYQPFVQQDWQWQWQTQQWQYVPCATWPQQQQPQQQQAQPQAQQPQTGQPMPQQRRRPSPKPHPWRTPEGQQQAGLQNPAVEHPHCNIIAGEDWNEL